MFKYLQWFGAGIGGDVVFVVPFPTSVWLRKVHMNYKIESLSSNTEKIQWASLTARRKASSA